MHGFQHEAEPPQHLTNGSTPEPGAAGSHPARSRDRRDVDPTTSTPRDGALVVAPSQPTPEWIVLEVAGALDLAGAPRLRTALDQAITAVARDAARADLAPSGTAPARARVVCDLGGVGFLGAAGVAVLLEATEAAHTDDVDLTVRARHPAVLRALTVTDTMRHLRWDPEHPRPADTPTHAA